MLKIIALNLIIIIFSIPAQAGLFSSLAGNDKGTPDFVLQVVQPNLKAYEARITSISYDSGIVTIRTDRRGFECSMDISTQDTSSNERYYRMTTQEARVFDQQVLLNAYRGTISCYTDGANIYHIDFLGNTRTFRHKDGALITYAYTTDKEKLYSIRRLEDEKKREVTPLDQLGSDLEDLFSALYGFGVRKPSDH